jgi:hypothetical protein
MASHAASLRDRLRAMIAPDSVQANTDAKKPDDKMDAPAPTGDDGDGKDDENPMTDKDAAAPKDDAEDNQDGGADDAEENPDGTPKKKPKAEAEAGQVDATATERARWATVLRSDAAAMRMTAAIELLAETDMPADRLMASLGKFAAEKPTGADFASRMDGEANPLITPNGGTDATAAPSVLATLQARHQKKGA